MIQLPDIQTEEWKYSRLARFSGVQFTQSSSSSRVWKREDLPIFSSEHFIIFVNGHYQESSLPNSAIVLEKKSATDFLSKSEFETLNREQAREEIHLSIKEKISAPIFCFFITDPTVVNEASFYRLKLWWQERSEATVVFCFIGDSPLQSLTQINTEIQVATQAKCRVLKYQKESTATVHLSYLHIMQQEQSEVSCFQAQLGSHFLRETVLVDLEKKAAQVSLRGIFLANQSQHLDTHTRIDHYDTEGVSEENYKGIVSDRAKAVYNGKIFVHEHAHKTRSTQINKNILLSSAAEIDTKPELEIYAEEVQCSHGATVGDIHEEGLFYLQSRGIPEKEARHLLLCAFPEELIAGLSDPTLQTWLRSSVMQKIEEMEHGLAD